MSEILLNLIEKNLDEFYSNCSKHPNFESVETEQIKWVYAKNADWPSCIYNANFANCDVDIEIERIKKLIESNKAPDGWTIGPLTEPNNLGKALESHGFFNVFHQAGMALDLNLLLDVQKNSSSLEIKAVDNNKELESWATVVAEVFHINIDYELLDYLLSQKEVRFYIGIFKRKIISALLLYLIPGAAGLHAVSTLQEYRRKDFAFRMSRRALQDAHNLGYNLGVLQASAMGQHVYKKLGFQKYCEIITYALSEE